MPVLLISLLQKKKKKVKATNFTLLCLAWLTSSASLGFRSEDNSLSRTLSAMQMDPRSSKSSFAIKEAFCLTPLLEQLSRRAWALVWGTLRSEQHSAPRLYQGTKQGIAFSNRLQISGENNSSASQLHVQETSSLSYCKHLRKVQRQLSHWTSFTSFGSFAVF